MEEKFTLRLEEMKKEAIRTGWIHPQGVYGYFPCQADGDDLVLFDPGSLAASTPVELTRFSFPRQSEQEHLCLADYFLPLGSAAHGCCRAPGGHGRAGSHPPDRSVECRGRDHRGVFCPRSGGPDGGSRCQITCMPTSAANWVWQRTRGSGIPGDTPPSPNLQTIKKSSTCFRWRTSWVCA